MKWRPTDQPTIVSTDDVVLANRFEERRADDARRNRHADSPYTRHRVSQLFRELGASIAPPKRPSRYQAGTEPCRQLTVEEVAEMYRQNPVTLSEQAKATL